MAQPKQRKMPRRRRATTTRTPAETSDLSGLALVASAIGNIAQASKSKDLEREREQLVAVLRDWQEAYHRLEERARALRTAYEKVATQLREVGAGATAVAHEVPGLRGGAEGTQSGFDASRGGEAMSAPRVIRQVDQEFEVLASLEQKLAHLARRLQGARVQSAFWKGPRGLEIRAVRYDEEHDDFVIAFRAGREYRLPASVLEVPTAVEGAELDEFKHGVVVHLSDGSETSFASDLVLYECEPAYRAAHRASGTEKKPDFGARIRTLRLTAGLPAKGVAAAAGLAPSNYARLEASRHQPRIETLVRVAKALGVPLADLVALPG